VEQVSFKSGMEERGILEEVMDGVIMVSAIPLSVSCNDYIMRTAHPLNHTVYRYQEITSSVGTDWKKRSCALFIN